MSIWQSWIRSLRAHYNRHCAVQTARTHRKQQYRLFSRVARQHCCALEGDCALLRGVPEYLCRPTYAFLRVLAAHAQKTLPIYRLTFHPNRRAAQDARAPFLIASRTSQAQRRLRCAVRSVARLVREAGCRPKFLHCRTYIMLLSVNAIAGSFQKQLQILKQPRVLVLHLKRWRTTIKTSRSGVCIADKPLPLLVSFLIFASC